MGRDNKSALVSSSLETCVAWLEFGFYAIGSRKHDPKNRPDLLVSNCKVDQFRLSIYTGRLEFPYMEMAVAMGHVRRVSVSSLKLSSGALFSNVRGSVYCCC